MKKGFVLSLTLVGATFVGGLVGAGLWVWNIDRTWSPLIEPRLRERQQLGSIRILARAKDGQDKWVGSLTSGRTEERQPLTLADIPPGLTQAIVTLEDPRFLEHGGFDVLGILRAIVKNVIHLRYSQGGSTITQQLVKNVFLTKEKTISRKFTELVIAALVEKRFTKDEILQAYMNEVYLGQLNNIEIHGVARAAEYYFGKKLDRLEIHEMALIAAMIAGPGYYSPWRHPERTKTRRDKVLRNLVDAQLILPAEYQTALEKALPKNPNFIAQTRSAYLMDALREDLVANRSEIEIVRGGFDVRLALDIDLQEQVEKVLTAKSAEWGPKVQALVIAADPRNCTIKAYAGGTDYRVTQLDRIRQSRRPIGSLMKPLEVARLLEDDPTINLASLYDDQPLKWTYDNGRQSWSPANFDLKFRGKTTLRHALEDSINVPIVRIFFERNPSGLLSELLEPVRALGLDIPPERALPSAILGAVDQTPRTTMSAFLRLTRQALGMAHDAGDFGCRLSFEEKPIPMDAPNTVIEGVTSTPANFGQKGARLVIAAMEGALRRGTGTSLGKKLPITTPWATKTGTSSDKRDSWFVALSPQLVILSWVGRDDNEITPFTGASGALPVVAELISGKGVGAAAADTPGWNWPQPNELHWTAIDSENKCLPSDDLARKIGMNSMTPKSGTPPPQPFALEGRSYVYELFREGAEPTRCAR